jgi:hypothetical protein
MATYILYGITGIAWVVALVWVLVAPGFEPLLAFLAGCASLVTTFLLPQGAGGSGGPQVTFTNKGNNSGQQAGIVHGGMHQNQQHIHNNAQNQGAQGQFHGPVNVTRGEVDAREADFSGAQGVHISGVNIDKRGQRDERDDAQDRVQ